MNDHQTLVALLANRSAKRGDFVLASGRRSNLYIDCRLTAMSPEGQLLIGRAGLAALAETGWSPDSVGGLTLGADPISYAIAHASALAVEAGKAEKMVRSFTVRKEPKQHGTGKVVEGPFQSGDRVVVIEDVITTGGSALKAVESIRAAGGEIVGVLALVDREEGGREAIEATGLKVHSLAKASEILPLLG
ncbi:MAG: orotate phosphoribosyltransferase [Gemmatimonas sp.]